ncbi:MAG: ABC transporter permease [Bacteroidota bacterium]
MIISNYIKIAIRVIRKNRLYSALNIFGLALGIAASLFILQYTSYEKNYDVFHTNYENLYRINYKVFQEGDLKTNSATSVPRAGSFMKEYIPEVKEFTRLYPEFGVVTHNIIKYRENGVFYTDNSFFLVFDFPVLHGNTSEALKGPNQLVITESMALKYFEKTNVVGERLSYNTWLNGEIKAVIEDVPVNSHLQFDMLISFETLNNHSTESNGYIASEDSWDWSSFYTYILLENDTDFTEVNAKFAKLFEQERGDANREIGIKEEFSLQPITEIHLHSNLEAEADPDGQGDSEIVFFLSVIAIFILVIAWINYINLSTARSLERAKEVGIRKAVGASRKQLIFQFLAEAFILNFLALAIALTVVLLGLDIFNQLTGSALAAEFLRDQKFWLMAGSIFVSGSFISGFYPAIVLSSFRPTGMLKGRFSSNKTGTYLRRTLVVTQFIVSISLIAGTVIVFQQLNYMKSAQLGFSMADRLVIQGPMITNEDTYASSLSAFKEELLQNSMVENVTATSNIPGENIIWVNQIKKIQDSDEKLNPISFVSVDYDYFPTFDMDLLAGRNYQKSFSTDTGALIINQSAVKMLGYQNPEAAINQKVKIYDEPKTIIGVVSDFQQLSAKNAAFPMVFPLANDNSYFFSVKLQSGSYQEATAALQSAYEKFFPGNPFEFFVLDAFFNRLYETDEQFKVVFTLFALLAIVIACLGLFGLTSFNALQKTKEIGIRKTLGARIKDIFYLLTKEFIVMIAVANLIAWPLIYLAMENWLDNYASRISVNFIVFGYSGLIVMIIALLTVGFKVLQTAQANPVEALRNE